MPFQTPTRRDRRLPAGMGSFARVLRRSLRYRWLIAASVVSSLMVDLFWGLNITTLYPVMEVVFRGEALQDIVAAKIDQLSAEVESLRRQAAAAGDEPPAALAAAEQALAVAQGVHPWLQRWVPNDPFRTMAFVLGAVMVGTVLKGLFLAAGTYTVGRLTQLTIFDLRNEFYQRILRMDLHVFDRDRSSGLVSRCTYDFERLSEGLAGVFSQGVREPVKMLSCLVGAACICWPLLLLTLLMVPFGWLAMRVLSRVIKETTQYQMDIVQGLYHRLDESFQGIKTIRVFARERYERRRMFIAARRFLRQTKQLLFVSLFKPLGEIIGMAGVTLAVLAGSYLVLNQQTHLFGVPMCSRPLSPAALLLFYAFLVGMADPARKMSSVGAQLYVGMIAAQRILEFMEREVNVADPPQPRVLATRRPDIELRNLWFQYQRDQPVLCDVSLHVPFGQTVAIVGPNGCGKSTLVNLIPRLYDSMRGAVLVGGEDVRHVRQRDLRGLIGMVAHDTILFDDTVLENIRYGRPGASDEEVFAAARQAQVHDCIVDVLPDGYATVVGQKGSRLSSGQRQRIALARAILRDPPILILDEATSHIDLESERLIHSALETFLPNRTTFLITHRHSALRLADRVVVMDAGRIVDAGASDELLARCDVYQRLYRRELAKAA